MASLYHVLFLSLSFSFSSTSSLAGNYIGHHCDDKLNSSNHIHALANIVAKASVGGFSTSTYADDNSTAYGLAQCPGDVGPPECSLCLAVAGKKLASACATLAAYAVIAYDHCLIHFDGEDFFGGADTGRYVVFVRPSSEYVAGDREALDREVGALMSRAKAKAKAKAQAVELGRGRREVSAYTTVCGLAQCTRDLEPSACAMCSSGAKENLWKTCRYRKGCQLLYSGCIARCEVYPFFPLYPKNSSLARCARAMHP